MPRAYYASRAGGGDEKEEGRKPSSHKASMAHDGYEVLAERNRDRVFDPEDRDHLARERYEPSLRDGFYGSDDC